MRALAGLGAFGVAEAWLMPAADGLGAALQAQLRAHAHTAGASPLPALRALSMRLRGTAQDTERAVEMMRERGVGALLVLGGDGTHRVVARTCGQTPICALSTGTNNVFPETREATVAGIATALALTGRGGPRALRREMALRVVREDGTEDLALVDVALSAERFLGARALWRPGALRELVAAVCDPAAVGLAAIAGALAPSPRGSGRGAHVTFAADPGPSALRLRVALAPGLLATVAVEGYRELGAGESVILSSPAGVLALDGERESELRAGERVEVTLLPGPLRIDVEEVMRHAAQDATRLQPPAP